MNPDTTAESKPPSVSKTLNKIDNFVDKMALQEALSPEEYCIKAGIELLDIYKELGDIATNAMITIKDSYGDPMQLGADNRSRLAAITLILELNKHIKDKSVALAVGVFNDPKLVEDAKRVLKLKNRLMDG